MTWRDWKKKIRATLDATEGFDVETDDIAFFDIVDGEVLEISRHKTITGMHSDKGAGADEDDR